MEESLGILDNTINELNNKKESLEVLISRLVEARAELISLTEMSQEKVEKKKRKFKYEGLTNGIRDSLRNSVNGKTNDQICDYLIEHIFKDADKRELKRAISTNVARLISMTKEIKKSKRDGRTVYFAK